METFMHGSRKFCQWGSEFDNVYLVDEGIENLNVTKNGATISPRGKRHFKWRFAGGPMMAQH